MLLQEAWAALKRLFWDENLNGVDWAAKLDVRCALRTEGCTAAASGLWCQPSDTPRPPHDSNTSRS